MFDAADRRRRFAVATCAWLLGASGALLAQVPAAPAPAAPAATTAPDPLGRDSPLGTVTGFSAAVRREDFLVAARYLELSGQSAQEAESLARDLSHLLDRYFNEPLRSLSASPAGSLVDGLDPDHERIALELGSRPVDVLLTRVTDAEAGRVWLFSAGSLADVPRLRRTEGATWIERVMPAALVARSFRGLSFAQWILWAASILVPLLVFWGLALVAGALVRRRIADATGRAAFTLWWRGVRWLLVLALTLVAHLTVQPLLGFSLTFRVAYARAGLTVGIVLGALLIWRVVSVTFNQARLLALRRGRSDTRSVILLGERVVKVLIIVAAAFGMLSLAGLDLTTALAGVGIVGVALALGAQKSVENLLGGLFLLSDKALAVGDFCRVSDRDGWVEDITLRSVRLRTLDQTLLSVPAGLLAQGSIENFSTRAKILFQTTLRLRYGTTAAQIRAVLDGVRQLLAATPLVEQESARIRLTAYGAQAVELEMFAYLATAEFPKFLEAREALLLQVADVVEAAGTAFAGPTQFVQLAGGTPGDAGVQDDRPRVQAMKGGQGA